MRKLNSNQIERFAIKAVNDEANLPFSGLVPDLKEGDKGVSFDGEITVFLDHTERVEAFSGKVPVQVKGKEVSNFSGNTRTFSLPLKHYKNFYKQSGVLLFVVELITDLNGKCTSKIYYKQLLPQELFTLIKNDPKNKKSKSILLRSLEESDLKTVCAKFLYEQKQQPLALIESNRNTGSIYSQYILSSLTYDPINTATNNMFEHDFFVYGKDETYDILVPLQVGRFTELAEEKQEIMIIGNKSYSFKIKTTEDSKFVYRDFEDVLKITHRRGTNKMSFNLSNFRTLNSQLKIIDFMKSVLTNLIVPWNEETLEFEDAPKKTRFMNNIKAREHLILDLQKVFTELNISADAYIKQIDPKKDIFMQLAYLVEFYLYNNLERLNIPNKKPITVFNYRLGNKLVVLFYNPGNEKKIVNVFSDEAFNGKGLIFIKDESANKSYPNSLYILLGLDSLAYSINLNFQMIKDSFDNCDPFISEATRAFSNQFYLNCIRAYDITINDSFLDLAEYIIGKYYISPACDPNSFEAAIVKVNEIQIIKRKNEYIDDSDIECLINFKYLYSFNEYTSLHFSINVLLGSKQEAVFAFQKLDKDIQDTFREYPIFFLYDQLLKRTD
ncbi:hypothetical protein [Paenibacillus pedocola]|uniref:hypothetical protein n=1 Tax=Paenibacillus pedocola TaxID=3242193 RepID=UPI0028779E24|nr:hypothetical protein [Paenibacillus typhae]